MLDLYATSVDYDPRSEDLIEFFRIIQSKLYFTTRDHTAAEVIYERADSEKLFMGPTALLGELLALKDISIVENCLNEEELKVSDNFVSGYLDLAEISAMEHKPMYMKDYVDQLDAILLPSNRKLLAGYGKVGCDQMMKEAKTKYRRYQKNALSSVERSYVEIIKDVGENAKKRVRKEDGNRK